jgi:predicted acetyltransferase
MQLVWPAPRYLAGYIAALKRGWSGDNVRGAAAARDDLVSIAAGAAVFLERQVDREAKGPPVVLPDGSTVPRLPGFRCWIWDGDFCGVIGFRWQRGTAELPPHVLGHIGYSVVPWKRRRGYATGALRAFLPYAWAEGLPYVELTADPDNVPSQRVIEANGGRLVERFIKPAQYGGAEGLRYRIAGANVAGAVRV